jgi:hypothetical protein
MGIQHQPAPKVRKHDAKEGTNRDWPGSPPPSKRYHHAYLERAKQDEGAKRDESHGQDVHKHAHTS